MNNDLSSGFDDPVADAQSCFRAVLDAMAHPGRVLAVAGVAAPAPLCDAAAAVLLTLADHETPLWLDPEATRAAGWIAFHTGAPIAMAGKATFAMALSWPNLDNYPHGTDEMPETSATIILQVMSLIAGRPFILEGPGLCQPAQINCDGLPDDFVSIWQSNHALFPRGIDMILCAGNQLAALPRTLNVRNG